MIEDRAEWERTLQLILQLPERERAHHALGVGLMQSLRLADITRRPEDLAYAQEVASRIYAAAPPERQEQFHRWFQPGGLLTLWPNLDKSR